MEQKDTKLYNEKHAADTDAASDTVLQRCTIWRLQQLQSCKGNSTYNPSRKSKTTRIYSMLNDVILSPTPQIPWEDMQMYNREEIWCTVTSQSPKRKQLKSTCAPERTEKKDSVENVKMSFRVLALSPCVQWCFWATVSNSVLQEHRGKRKMFVQVLR